MAERVEVVNRASAVCLRRLLRIADLTPAQAHFLAREITVAVTSSPSGAADFESVLIDQSGEAVVTPGGDPAGLAAVLSALAVVGEKDARYGAPLRAAAEATEAGAGPAAILSILDEVRQAPEQRLAEVSALVGAAIGRDAPQPMRPGPVGPAPEDGVQRPALRVVLRPVWRAIAALVVLAAAVLLEFVFLHDRLASDVRLLGGQQPGTPSTASVRTPQPVEAPAPASAGAVSGVELRALLSCDPGTRCGVAVLVRLLAQPQPVTVRWEFQLTDRCTGARTTTPGGTVVAAPGDRELTVVDQVPLPAARALAVHVVTASPAQAAGAPLLVGDASC